MKTFYIEYEIPPLRAIYTAYCEAEIEKDVRDYIKQKETLWNIRKIEPCCAACQCRITDDGCGCNPHDA